MSKVSCEAARKHRKVRLCEWRGLNCYVYYISTLCDNNPNNIFSIIDNDVAVSLSDLSRNIHHNADYISRCFKSV